MNDCEICKHFEEHPFVREIRDDYCNGYEKFFNEIDNEMIWLCPHFEENTE